jgi:hypothetical protein
MNTKKIPRILERKERILRERLHEERILCRPVKRRCLALSDTSVPIALLLIAAFARFLTVSWYPHRKGSNSASPCCPNSPLNSTRPFVST